MPPNNMQQPMQGYNMVQKKRNKLNMWLVICVVLSVFLTIFIGLFVWAYMGRQDYKNNVTPKIDAAVKVAVQNEDSRKDNEFVQKEKSPFKTFIGPDTFGGVTFNYPKTWSAYVINDDKAPIPLDGYLHPNYVPSIGGSTAYALRIRVLDKQYSEELKTYEPKTKQGKITATAYVAKNQPKVIGTRLDGEVNTGQKDHMVILPLRDKTLEISTESDQFIDDFEKIILDSFNFTP